MRWQNGASICLLVGGSALFACGWFLRGELYASSSNRGGVTGTLLGGKGEALKFELLQSPEHPDVLNFRLTNTTESVVAITSRLPCLSIYVWLTPRSSVLVNARNGFADKYRSVNWGEYSLVSPGATISFDVSEDGLPRERRGQVYDFTMSLSVAMAERTNNPIVDKCLSKSTFDSPKYRMRFGG
jgi:hypothetical protein